MATFLFHATNIYVLLANMSHMLIRSCTHETTMTVYASYDFKAIKYVTTTTCTHIVHITDIFA